MEILGSNDRDTTGLKQIERLQGSSMVFNGKVSGPTQTLGEEAEGHSLFEMDKCKNSLELGMALVQHFHICLEQHGVIMAAEKQAVDVYLNVTKILLQRIKV